MAWASTDIVPTSQQIQANYSSGASAFLNPVTFKIAPRSSTNALFDFTAATVATINASNNPGLPAGLQTPTTVTPTLVAHDATGLTLSCSAAQLTTLAAGCGTTNLPLSILVTDGTTQLLASTGTLSTTLVP
jgi:hypothetical protein